MIDILTLSIGVGLVVALLFAEFYGFKAGGLVVPGYFALHITDPIRLVMTLLVAFATFLCVRLVATVVVVYGKRRTALAILFGYAIGVGVRAVIVHWEGVTVGGSELEVIGFIIPGLIALWMDRQGIVETITSLVTVSVVTRLALILMVPGQMKAYQEHLRPKGMAQDVEVPVEI